ncbi:MAG: TrkH family potassium uptake protein [Tannerella sp.]|nr:TrkH family potassium uptake protein [Tannerella sp.]
MKFTYTQVIVACFFALIFLGGFLLCLPVASKTGEWTVFIDAVFTAASALCVTGLIVFDTWTHWSLFGQVVILLLIQTGGIGFMTVITIFSIYLKRTIGLHERQLLTQSTGLLQLGGVVRLIKKIVKIVIAFELIGAVILAVRFCPQMGFGTGLWNAVFHSISAFCNAGFDLMGKYGAFSSLTGYVNDFTVSLTIAALIVAGGIGFAVLDDMLFFRWRFHKYALNSKIALSVTGMLIVGGCLLFYLFEYNGLMKEFTVGEKIVASLFQSVSPRTAGFNSIDLAGLTEASVLLTIVLMIIGGSSGSTAGGIKTSTLAILIFNAFNSIRKTHSMVAFKRRLDDKTAKRAAAIVTIYLFAILAASIILCAVEECTMKEALFETASALGTVGLTLGITASLGVTGKIVLITLMFAGRVGWITLLLALARKRFDPPMERPAEKILIG